LQEKILEKIFLRKENLKKKFFENKILRAKILEKISKKIFAKSQKIQKKISAGKILGFSFVGKMF